MAFCFRRMSIVGCQPVLPDPFGTRVPVIVCLERSRNPLPCSLFGGQRTFGRRLLQRLFHLRTHHKQTSSSQLTITTLFRNKNPNCLLAFYSSDGCTVTSVLRGRPPPPPPPLFSRTSSLSPQSSPASARAAAHSEVFTHLV